MKYSFGSSEFDEADEMDEIEGEVLEAEFSAAEAVEAAPAMLAGGQEAADLVERSRKLLEKMHAEDREEAIDLHEKIGAAIESGDGAALGEASRALRELLFFMEGRPN